MITAMLNIRRPFGQKKDSKTKDVVKIPEVVDDFLYNYGDRTRNYKEKQNYSTLAP